MSHRFGRRAGLFALLASLSACATPDAEPVATAPEPEQDRDPEDVYSPGAIPWSDLTEEHKRRPAGHRHHAGGGRHRACCGRRMLQALADGHRHRFG